MGVGSVQNFFGRTGLHELLHHLASEVARVLDLAVQLAVGKRAGAAFAELHIALRVELAFAPQAPGIFGSLAHGFAAFQNNWLEAHLRQHQRGKNAAGPKAHHHGTFVASGGPIARGVGGRLPCHVGRGLDMRVGGVLVQQLCFLRRVGQGHIDDVDHLQLGFARIKAALENLPLLHVLGRDAQRAANFIEQRCGGQGRWRGLVGGIEGGVEGKLEF